MLLDILKNENARLPEAGELSDGARRTGEVRWPPRGRLQPRASWTWMNRSSGFLPLHIPLFPPFQLLILHTPLVTKLKWLKLHSSRSPGCVNECDQQLGNAEVLITEPPTLLCFHSAVPRENSLTLFQSLGCRSYLCSDMATGCIPFLMGFSSPFSLFYVS